MVKVATPPFHREIVGLIENREYQRIAIAAPRGHAKTSLITRGWTIRALLECFEPFIVVIGQKHEMAAEHISAIYEIIRNNERIQQDYRPQFIRERPGDGDLIVKTINGVSRIAAFGQGQSTRGLLDGQDAQRPTLALIDDLEENKRVMNPVLRNEDHDWLVSVVMPMLDPQRGRTFFIGTILHEDSVLARHTGLYGEIKRQPMPGWITRLYCGIQDDGTALWPEWQPVEKLLADKQIAADAGRVHLWYQEIQNDPRRGKDAEFSDNWLQFIDTSDPVKREWWDEKKKKCNFYLTADTAWSEKDTADQTAIAVGAWDDNYNAYIMPPSAGRWLPHTTFDEIVKLKNQYPLKRYGIEKGATKAALGDILDRENRKRGWKLNFDDLSISDGNEALIRGWFTLMARGEVWLVGRPEEFNGLIEEWKSFPNGVHDDMAVAVAHQIQIARPTAKPPAPAPAMFSGARVLDELMAKIKKQ